MRTAPRRDLDGVGRRMLARRSLGPAAAVEGAVTQVASTRLAGRSTGYGTFGETVTAFGSAKTGRPVLVSHEGPIYDGSAGGRRHSCRVSASTRPVSTAARRAGSGTGQLRPQTADCAGTLRRAVSLTPGREPCRAVDGEFDPGTSSTYRRSPSRGPPYCKSSSTVSGAVGGEQRAVGGISANAGGNEVDRREQNREQQHEQHEPPIRRSKRRSTSGPGAAGGPGGTAAEVTAQGAHPLWRGPAR